MQITNVWQRLLCFALGAGAIAAGSLLGIPTLSAAGVGAIGWVMPFPGDASKSNEKKEG